MKDDDKAEIGRRSVLKAFGLAGASVAVVAADAVATTADAAESDADKRKARYRESDHVKSFYRTNRY